MAGQVQLIAFGGTLLMKKDGANGLVPAYDLDTIIPGGAEAYGYASKAIKLKYDPIDSINFDVDTHYAELREAVLKTIRNGDVPVIAGGTDTLRFYGTLLAEDLAHLEATKCIGKLPPVILVSSMYAYGENPEHVERLLKAARIAADEAVIEHKSGVFAMQPDDEVVSAVGLIDMQKASDKISGNLVKAFVGTEAFRINPETKTPGQVYPHHDPRRQPENVKEIAPLRRRLVAPPLEASNSPAAVQYFLHAVNANPDKYPFKAIVIKGALADGRVVPPALLRDIAELRQKHIAVIFVNDPRADKSGKLVYDSKFASAPSRRTLEAAGAIFEGGVTSTQMYIRQTLADERDAPHGNFESAQMRETANQAAADYLKQHANDVVPPTTGAAPQALALEYVPVKEAYATAVKLAEDIGVKKLISVNCIDGSLAELHEKTFRDHPKIKVICSFKYAGVNYDGKVESATLSKYAPAVHLLKQGLVIAGGETPPEKLLSSALAEGRM